MGGGDPIQLSNSTSPANNGSDDRRKSIEQGSELDLVFLLDSTGQINWLLFFFFFSFFFFGLLFHFFCVLLALWQFSNCLFILIFIVCPSSCFSPASFFFFNFIGNPFFFFCTFLELGSMGSYIRSATQSIQDIVLKIKQMERADVKFALIAYRDHPPQDRSFVTKVFPFTSDTEEMTTYLRTIQASGGGDGLF